MHSDLYKLKINKTKVIKDSRKLKETLQNLEHAIMKGSLDNDFQIDFTTIGKKYVSFEDNLEETIQSHRVNWLKDLYAIQKHLNDFNAVMKIKDQEENLETNRPLQTIMQLGDTRFVEMMHKILFPDAIEYTISEERRHMKNSVSLNDMLIAFHKIVEQEERRIYEEKEMDKAFGIKKKKKNILDDDRYNGMLGRTVGTELYTMPNWEREAIEKKKAKDARIKLKKTLANKAVKLGIPLEILMEEIEKGLRGKTGNPKRFYKGHDAEKELAEEREWKKARELKAELAVREREMKTESSKADC